MLLFHPRCTPPNEADLDRGPFHSRGDESLLIPCAIFPGGTSRVTTAPEQTYADSPMRTDPTTVALIPTKAPAATTGDSSSTSSHPKVVSSCLCTSLPNIRSPAPTIARSHTNPPTMAPAPIAASLQIYAL